MEVACLMQHGQMISPAERRLYPHQRLGAERVLLQEPIASGASKPKRLDKNRITQPNERENIIIQLKGCVK